MRRILRPLLIALALPISMASAQEAETDLPREEIERIVREYLMREPEIIYEAIQSLQERQKLAEQERQQQMLTAHASAIFDDERDAVMNVDGDVTMVEFFDYRCGYCRRMTTDLQTLMLRDPGIRFVMKEFPILGEDSMRAAKAALAAKRQGAYDGFHAALMSASDMSMDAIERLAEHFDLDFDQLADDMESPEIEDHIEANLDLGRSLGISGTPSFIIGETIVPGAAPINQLAELIAEEREASTAN